MNPHFKLLFLISFILLLVIGNAHAQQSTFVLSKNADYSTDDRQFYSTETLYVKVVADYINKNDLDKNELKLSPLIGGRDIEKPFEFSTDGAFVAQVDLSSLGSGAESWEVEARLEDNNEREFRQKVTITISTINGDDGSEGGNGDEGDRDDSGGGNDMGDGGDTGSGDDDTGGDTGDGEAGGEDSQGDAGEEGSGESQGDEEEESEEEDSQVDEGVGAGTAFSIHGAIDAISQESISIAELIFQISHETVVTNVDDVPIPVAWLKVGAAVTVTGFENDGGQFRADRITWHGAGPLFFHLHNNFPNPFIDRTEIQVEIFESGPISVRLVVYDVLGRTISVLVDDVLDTGRHNFTWEPGASNIDNLASGVYFIRIESNGFSQTRTMLRQK